MGTPASRFPRPDGIEEMEISTDSGSQPSGASPPDRRRTEIFASGQGPLGPEHDFHRSMVESPKVLAWLGQLASECFGRRLNVCPVTNVPDREEEGLRQRIQREVLPTVQQELERRTDANPELRRLIEGLGGKIEDEG